jgi:UDP-4-amino-4,6-dideoxy-N-acetyl-beta-L-altrosamine transaminase
LSERLHYGAHLIDEADIAAVVAALRSERITQGPRVAELESQLARWTGAAHASAVANGTAALHLAYAALGLGPGDEIITSPITFVATANAARMLGADVRFADVHPDSGNLDAASVARLIGPRTRGIVPVHFGGLPVELEPLRSLADRHGLWIVEDAAHALGARYREQAVGSGRYSQATTFSFHPVKHITTGEGGAVCTNDPELKRRLDRLREHGLIRTPAPGSGGHFGYEQTELGYNYRLCDVLCALGISQLQKLPRFIERRRALAALYRSELAELGTPWVTPTAGDGAHAEHAYHLFSVLIDFERAGTSRARVMTELVEQGIVPMVHYIPVCDQPYYVQRYGRAECERARAFYQRQLSLPLHVRMNEADVRRVVRALDQAIRRGGEPAGSSS